MLKIGGAGYAWNRLYIFASVLFYIYNHVLYIFNIMFKMLEIFCSILNIFISHLVAVKNTFAKMFWRKTFLQTF